MRTSLIVAAALLALTVQLAAAATTRRTTRRTTRPAVVSGDRRLTPITAADLLADLARLPRSKDGEAKDCFVAIPDTTGYYFIDTDVSVERVRGTR